jgi:hypothetical protein
VLFAEVDDETVFVDVFEKENEVVIELKEEDELFIELDKDEDLAKEVTEDRDTLEAVLGVSADDLALEEGLSWDFGSSFSSGSF